MKPRFNQAKTAQVAGRFLRLAGGQMHYMMLIKLMYITDRAALISWGRPLTWDSYVSMPHGPVLSATLDLINEGPTLGQDDSPWHKLITRHSDPYQVKLKCDPPDEELSEAEEELIATVFDKYGRINRFTLRDMLHQVLPEWKDPKGSSLPIEYRDILAAGRKSSQEIAEIESEIEGVAMLDALA